MIKSSTVVKTETFAPILYLLEYEIPDAAIQRANDVDLGLTAGLFSDDPEQIAQFFDRIQAGVTYVNRQSGATTGAWPGCQAFGGWKGSGSTGKAAGSFYYAQQYMHEQSRTLVKLD